MRTTILLASAALLSCTPKPPDFSGELQRAVSDYPAYGRVDDWTRWGTPLCSLPPPTHARISEATPSSPHGRKLHTVFAKDRESYVRGGPQPAGQVIVKEAWMPVAAPEVTSLHQAPRAEEHHAAYAERDGRIYKAGARAGLFVMLKRAVDDPGTDQGWVYGTVSADGRTVTSAGKLGSCMDCHVEARPDRLFGLPR